MSGGIQLWPPRIIAGGYIVVVPATSATLQSSLGGVVSVTYNGVGLVDVVLRSPGVRRAPLPQALLLATPQGDRYIGGSFASDTLISFGIFDDSGTNVDANFSFLVIQAERLGGV